MFFSVEPRLSDYLEFISPEALRSGPAVEDRLITLDSTGNYRVKFEYSSTLVKLYILHNWDLYTEAGISENELWRALGSLSGDEGFLKFSLDGKQLNYNSSVKQLNGIVLGNLAVRHTQKYFWLFWLATGALLALSVFFSVKLFQQRDSRVSGALERLYLSSIN